jgi:acetoin utilization protein AcuC
MKAAFLYSEKFGAFNYGKDHPMRPERLRQTFELIKELGLDNIENTAIIEARAATREELLTAHTADYLDALERANSGMVEKVDAVHNLGRGDCPAFEGVYEWSSFSAGASLQAAELIASGKARAAFNIAGGLHHAMANKASGFCYINDAVVAIKRLTKLGKRVAYIDIDAHHGDGVEEAFKDTNQVLTISLHESGFHLFPGTGFPENMGEGQGKGFSINLPLPPGTGDELFLYGFNKIVPAFMEKFAPDILVTQLGVDTFYSDPLTHLTLTTNGFEEMLRTFKSFDLPWLALGGGGYNLDNVKRAWTIAWAIMCNEDVPDKLRDQAITDKYPGHDKMKKDIDRAAEFLLSEVLPLTKK